jgi:hypothetical protein
MREFLLTDACLAGFRGEMGAAWVRSGAVIPASSVVVALNGAVIPASAAAGDLNGAIIPALAAARVLGGVGFPVVPAAHGLGGTMLPVTAVARLRSGMVFPVTALTLPLAGAVFPVAGSNQARRGAAGEGACVGTDSAPGSRPCPRPPMPRKYPRQAAPCLASIRTGCFSS